MTAFPPSELRADLPVEKVISKNVDSRVRRDLEM
jgi:hypothetical protein